MITTRFCDACGAALSRQTHTCSVCGQLQQLQGQTLAPQLSISSDELQPGSLLRKRYRIQKKIGAGGFGLVYKAWDEKERRQVAVKQITLAALSAREMIEATDSYNREIAFLPKLRHKSLPTLYHHFTGPGHWYIVMQYINGQTLEEYLAEAPQGRLAIGEVLSIGAALCNVLGYLHLQDPSIVFRDVKPANIMRSRRGGIYLIDFGIARRYREGQSKDTGPLGSPGYAAPEQYGKAQSTPRTDMYGLGATLQTLLTGKEPGEIQAQGIPANCFIPDELRTLIAQMLEVDPEQRPAFMWRVRTSLQTLEKRYPDPLPFSGWMALWMFFMITISPVFFAEPIYSSLPLLALCLIIIAYQWYRARRTVPVKTLRTLINAGFITAFNVGGYVWAWIFLVALSLNFFPPSFNILQLIRLLVYIAVSIAGLFLIQAVGLLLNRRKQKRAAQRQQQAVQVPLMEQEIRQ